jgi:hypothetical protein
MQIAMTGVMPTDTTLFVTAPVQNQQVIASESIDVALQVNGEDGLPLSIADGACTMTVRDPHGSLVYQGTFAFDTTGTDGKAHLTIPATALSAGQLYYDVVYITTVGSVVTHVVPPSSIYVSASIY